MGQMDRAGEEDGGARGLFMPRHQVDLYNIWKWTFNMSKHGAERSAPICSRRPVRRDVAPPTYPTLFTVSPLHTEAHHR